MGLDCNLWIMPAGKLTRRVPLDRYSYFTNVRGRFGAPGYLLASELEDLTQVKFVTGSQLHWVQVAIHAVNKACARWGDQVTCMILDENYGAPPRPEMAPAEKRLASLRRARQKRLQEEQFERDLAVCAQVKRELQEKIARQWD